mmetsp:Transcript_64628/g.142523  ORF Transcript_64628/g.142523 Transcript_64628/m.142523 type:complete len:193 (-) Transcript_64628:8-586(-)
MGQLPSGDCRSNAADCGRHSMGVATCREGPLGPRKADVVRVDLGLLEATVKAAQVESVRAAEAMDREAQRAKELRELEVKEADQARRRTEEAMAERWRAEAEAVRMRSAAMAGGFSSLPGAALPPLRLAAAAPVPAPAPAPALRPRPEQVAPIGLPQRLSGARFSADADGEVPSAPPRFGPAAAESLPVPAM